MSNLEITIPDSLLEGIKRLAARENVSVSHLATLALAEKLSALEGSRYIQERAARADDAAMLEVLSRIPDYPPIPDDQWMPPFSENCA